MLGYLSVSFEEQIMSKDKYPSIFSPQMETIMFIILQIFYATCAVLKIGVYSRISPSFSWGIFGHGTCLEQSCTSEVIWWIIISIILDLISAFYSWGQGLARYKYRHPVDSHLLRKIIFIILLFSRSNGTFWIPTFQILAKKMPEDKRSLLTKSTLILGSSFYSRVTVLYAQAG